jgi:hypothetical protein
MSLGGAPGKNLACALLIGAMGGCTRVPTVDVQEESVRIVDVVQRVKCEIYDALTERVETPRGIVMVPLSQKKEFGWLKPWTAQIDLNLLVNDQSGISPGATFIQPLPQVSLPGKGTFGQSATAGLGGGVGTTAARTETITFSLSVQEIQEEFSSERRRLALYNDCHFGKAGDLNGSLQLKEWIWSTLAPVEANYLKVGHHKSPKGGAASVGQKGVSALKPAVAGNAVAFAGAEPPAVIKKAITTIPEVTESIRTAGTDLSGPVVIVLNGKIQSAMDDIDAALAAIDKSKDDAGVAAAILSYAKKLQFKTTAELVEHLNVTRLTFKWVKKFNTLSQTQNISSGSIAALTSSLDTDMASLLSVEQTTETKAVYQVLETARQELKATSASFDPPIDSISHQVQFIVSWNASATPNWTLVSFKGPGPGSGAFLSGSRSDTHTLTIVLGSPADSSQKLNALQIGTSIGNTLGTTTIRVTPSP